MKLLLLSVLVAVAIGMSQARPSWEIEWNDWKIKFEKNYVEEEENKRQMIWEHNRHYVARHNYEHDLGQHTYRLGMNKYADLTHEEFKAMFLSNRKVGSDICKKGMYILDSIALPSEVDWRKQGYVTGVKNQAQCGSCWAFSATGSLEGQHFKKTGELVSLSEQNLLDCSTPDGDFGCEGGLMVNAFEYIINNKGVDTEASYPYEAMQEKCRFNSNTVGATMTSCVDLPYEDESALQKAVAMEGPISVAIDASHRSFQMYDSGVYYEPDCSETLLDHGVLAVGYGALKGADYWLVKNSWGTDWGMDGYLMMSRNKNNNCGIASNASYPIV